MSLEKYVEKRNFKKTAEPKSGKSLDKSKLIFVIQKHDATRLHYDFRLEMDGVLKSWAVPKGPSTDPKIKRLAMMVEDHPYDYKNFEGIIPKGEYGGGTVIVWDSGTYETIEPIKGKKAQEKYLLDELKKGSVKIKLQGKKLQGEFALVKTKGMGENAWLLLKHKDEFASVKDITKEDSSVISGKTIAAMKKDSEKIWVNGKEEENSPAKLSSKKKVKINTDLNKLSSNKIVTINKETIKKGKIERIPIGIKPMLATLVDEPFDDAEWMFEVKWDGYRSLAFVNKGNVDLLSRNNNSFNDKFYPIHKALKEWTFDAVIDGEILVLNESGISNFGQLQNWRTEADGELVYYIFDLLWFNGRSLMDLPLTERKEILKAILPTDNDNIRLSEAFDSSGTEFFKLAAKIGLEGIIAKKAGSLYTAGARSKEWLKIKVHKRQEVVIAGFTKNEDTAKQFSSLLLGVYASGNFEYAGKVGTGFSDKLQKEMMDQFKHLITDKIPFKNLPDINKPSRFQPHPPNAKATWLKPILVCEIAFAEITNDGVFRHPSFQGMRIDKKAKDVTRELPGETEDILKAVETQKNKQMQNEKPMGQILKKQLKVTKQKESGKTVDAPALSKTKKSVKVTDKIIKPPKSIDRKTLLNPTEETQVRKICGHEIQFTHLSKIYWPDDKVTKRDMFNYYYQVAEYILPYLKDRPMSLNRFPGGITGPGFYQKDIKGKAPEWIKKTFPYTTNDGEKKEYLVGADEAVLMWMASLGCIEMNPWFSRVQSPDNPDYCVIDLDPDKNTFNQVIAAALETKKVLDELKVPSFCKTSGSTGMHIYIPLGAKYTYDHSQMFARIIVNIVHNRLPEFTSIERMIAKRKGKMYLDFLQNRPGATIAGPYSLRPKKGATVSMPLHWDEVKPGLTMKDFTIFNAVERLKKEGDLFKGVLGKGIDLEKLLAKADHIE